MNRYTIALITVFFFMLASTTFGMQGHGSTDANHNSAASGGNHMKGGQGNHADMNHGSGRGSDGNYKHEMMADGVHAEFQVMSLESMNMSDDQGNTHHIMVKMFTDAKQTQVKEAIGRIKVVGPDGEEQIGTLKNYNGILAANFTFPKPGKYGVICLAKVDGDKKLFKFWYPHQ
jgi:hypothetical protein